MANEIIIARRARADGAFDVHALFVFPLVPPIVPVKFSSGAIRDWFKVAGGVTQAQLTAIDSGAAGFARQYLIWDRSEDIAILLAKLRRLYDDMSADTEALARSGTTRANDAPITVTRIDR